MFLMNSGRQVAQELKKQHHPLKAVRQQPGGDAFSQEQERSVHLEKKGNRLWIQTATCQKIRGQFIEMKPLYSATHCNTLQ